LTLAISFSTRGELVQPLRIEFEDTIYHLCVRGDARQPIVGDEREAQLIDGRPAGVLAARVQSRASRI
jgi:hypothetical protein